MTTITAGNNQSMSDVVLQATGSEEAAMQFCDDNGVSLSDVPVAGTVYIVSDAALALGDAKVLDYLVKNNVRIGTLNRKHDLQWRMALYVYGDATPNPASVATPPATLHYWDVLVGYNPQSHYGIAASAYPSAPNAVNYAGIDVIIAGGGVSSVNQQGTPLMPAYIINYRIPYSAVTRAMVVHTDLFNGGNPTVIYKDNNGNEVTTCPFILLKPTAQAVTETLQPELTIERVSGDDSGVTFRLTASNNAETSGLVTSIGLNFIDEATGGTADPLDPYNVNKTIVTMASGTHTFGVVAQYMNGVHVLGYAIIEMIVEVF